MEVGNKQAMTDQQRIAELKARLAIAVEALNPTEEMRTRYAERFEPKPELPACYSHLMLSPQYYWQLYPVMAGGMEWKPYTPVCDAGIRQDALAATAEAVAQHTASVERWEGGEA